MSITVTNTLHDSGGKPVVGAACPIVLIGAAAFDAGNIEIVGQAGTVTTDSTGTWSTSTLTPNSQLTPTGTYYMVYEPNASHAFTVPATGGPYTLNQLLVSSPTSPAASLGIVRYDVAQPLTPAQQAQAQQNIGTVAGGVTSFNARTGAVVAQTGDYTAAQVGADASGAAAAAQAAAQASSLQKSANLSDLASASTARTNLGLGTAATQNKVAAGSAGVLDATDPSTTNSRTPTAHASTHASAGSDPITIAESQVTNLTTDLASKVPTSRQLAGLDLTTDRTAAALKTALAIAEADVSGLTTDLAARALVMVPTATKTTAYTAAVNDLVLCDATTGSFAVTLPTAPADKSILEVKKLDASANTVTITCGGSDTYAIGGTTLVLALQGHAARLQYQTSTGKWIALDNDLPLAATDARYVGKSTVTTKGDLLVATGSGAVARHGVGADGQVLTADSTQADGVKWAAPAGGGAAALIPSGLWVFLNTPNNGSFIPTKNQEFAIPFLVGAQTISQLAFQVLNTPDAGAVIRLGIRADSAGKPGAPVSDNPVTVTANAWNAVTVNYAHPGGILWVTLTSQNWTTTGPSLEIAQPSQNSGLQIGTGAALSTLSWATGHGPSIGGQTGVTGALPAGFTNTINTNTSVPVIAGKGA